MNKSISTALVTFSFLFLGTLAPVDANAAFVTTNQMVEKAYISIEKDQILSTLDRDDVRQVLIAKGVDISHVQARVAAMSDIEIQSLQQDLDSLPAGAGAGSVLVTLVLVFVVLDIVGVTNVFTFIR